MESFPIHHIDSMFGPSRLARYRAGSCEAPSCNVSTQLWIDLHHDIDQDVRKSGTYNTESEIQKETSIRFMSLYVRDVQTIKQEWSGKEVIPADDLLVTNSGVMTRVGDEYVSAEYQFITKRQEKGLEDRSESRTLRAVMGAMVASEDAEAYFPVHNQGSDGTDQIRHVAHWKRVGNRIKAEMINISGNQSDKSLSEAQRTLETIIGKGFVRHQDSSRSYIFTRGVQGEHVHFSETHQQQELIFGKTQHKRTSLNLSPDRISDSRVTSEFFRETHQRNTLGRALSDTVIDVGNNVLRGTKDSMVALGAFALHQLSERKRELQTEIRAPDRHGTPTITERIYGLFSKNGRNKDRSNESNRLTLVKIREKSLRSGEVIEKKYAEMRQGAVALGVIAEMGVAVHAAPVILARLAEKVPTPVQVIAKSIRRHEERELRIKNKELRRVTKREVKKDSVKVQPLRPEGVEPLRAAKERKKPKLRAKVYMKLPTGSRMYTLGERGVRKDRGRGKRSRENGVKKVAAASEMIPSALGIRERQEKRGLRRVVEKSVRRHEKRELRMKKYELRKTKREVQKDSVKVQPLRSERIEPLKERKRRIQRKEREAVAGIVFGWMVWMILEKKSVLSEKIVKKKFVYKEYNYKQEPTPWVLFSIIWYLTAIREQGMVNTTNTTNTTNTINTTNHQIKKRQYVLPQHGVIFASAS